MSIWCPWLTWCPWLMWCAWLIRCPWLTWCPWLMWCPWLIWCLYVSLECFRKHDFAPLLLSPALIVTIPARCSIHVVRKPCEKVFAKTLYSNRWYHVYCLYVASYPASVTFRLSKDNTWWLSYWLSNKNVTADSKLSWRLVQQPGGSWNKSSAVNSLKNLHP